MDPTRAGALLDPNVVLRADIAVEGSLARQREGAPALAPETVGAAAVAEVSRGRARAAQPALIDGGPGAVFAPGGQPRAVMEFVIEGSRIVEIAVTADADGIRARELEILPAHI